MDATAIGTAMDGLVTAITPFIAPIFTGAVAIFAVLWAPKKGFAFFQRLTNKA